jgi:hypothetical protein
VLDQKASLVMRGGISKRGDTNSIRDVIRQIKAELYTDILLMNGTFGSVDPRDDKQWQKISDPNHFSEYRKGLEKLARDTNSAFLDMEAA